MKNKIFLVLLLILILTTPYADNIRGSVKNIITIKSDIQFTEFNLYDLTSIILEDNPFLEGLELTLTIPGDLDKYRDSFMINVYSKVDSIPDKSLKEYKGFKLLSTVIPISTNMFITIPVLKTLARDLIPGSILTETVSQGSFPLLLSVNPVMKGIPDSVLNSIFKLKIKPIISNKGILNLNIFTTPINSPYTIFIDDKKTSKELSYTLEEGIHQLKIVSEGFKEISRSFVINQNDTTKLELELKPFLPVVIFEAPTAAKIILDGKKIDIAEGVGIQLTPGEHVVRMELGDYFISKKFTVSQEKNYKISLSLDILVQDI